MGLMPHYRWFLALRSANSSSDSLLPCLSLDLASIMASHSACLTESGLALFLKNIETTVTMMRPTAKWMRIISPPPVAVDDENHGPDHSGCGKGNGWHIDGVGDFDGMTHDRMLLMKEGKGKGGRFRALPLRR
jgi:hypothetical protein